MSDISPACYCFYSGNVFNEAFYAGVAEVIFIGSVSHRSSMSFNDELGSVSQAQSVACLLMINLRYQLECCGEELIMTMAVGAVYSLVQHSVPL